MCCFRCWKTGVADSFTVTARDQYGNQNLDIPGRTPGSVGAVFTVSLDNAEIDMSHVGDGVYEVAYSINGAAADYLITISLGMNQLLEETIVVAPGPASVLTSTMTGQGTAKGNRETCKQCGFAHWYVCVCVILDICGCTHCDNVYSCIYQSISSMYLCIYVSIYLSIRGRKIS